MSLQAWGFSANFRKMILSCVTTVQYSLPLNGSVSGSFRPSRGLHQGDPLSPFLFILCTEMFSRMVAAEERMGRFGSIKLGRGVPSVSHLLYADDILVSCKAIVEYTDTIMRIFNIFEGWSGLRVNTEKSSLFFSPKTDRRLKGRIKHVTSFKDLQKGTVYLGNPFLMGRQKIKEFGRIQERVQCRLEGWQSQLLSRAGKATLIKTVAQAIPTYVIAMFRLPKKVCDNLDTIIRRFWWGTKEGSNRFLALKKWKEIYQLKDFGGLGFRLFSEFSSALLAKLGWKIACGEDSMWCNILRTKYLSNQSFFEHIPPVGASGIWKF